MPPGVQVNYGTGERVVPRHPSSPPSYREVADVVGLHDLKLHSDATARDTLIRAKELIGAEVTASSTSDAGSSVVEVYSPPPSPTRSGVIEPPSYEDALRSPTPSEPSARADHVHDVHTDEGASSSALLLFFFPPPPLLSILRTCQGRKKKV